jgi:pimeloyl-ACP methyl ester carboxylesterase
MTIQPFTLHISQETLDDLRERLARTRWPDEVEKAGWDYGTNLDYLKSLVAYWQDHFDWRAQEEKLNQFTHFKVDLDGLGIHFIHERGKGPHPLPLLLTHGWPDSFARFQKIIPRLCDPTRDGGDPADSFDVIVPSIPGFGFSDAVHTRGWAAPQTAEVWARLMCEVLGYRRFAAAGGDWGSAITRSLAVAHPDLLVGIHLTDVGYGFVKQRRPSDLTPTEQRYLSARQQWLQQEGAYALIQGSKPQTLAYGLNDSPAGLASWLVEKFRAWSDCDGDVERRFTKDELLTNIMIYWVTATVNSAARLYYESMHHASESPQRIEVPVGMAIFPKDIVPPPREWAERNLRIEHWIEMPRGGHFAAWEEPELLAEDLHAFFHPLR